MRKILITGCSKGIGYELVKIFAQSKGAQIIAVARDKIALEKLKSECYTINPNFQIQIISLDLSEPKGIINLIELISSDVNQKLHGVIHNAGCLVKKPFLEIDRKELDISFMVNFVAPFILTQKLVPFFSKNAHTLFISSMGGLQGSKKFPGLCAYSVSKSTLITLTECLAEEFKITDFSFNCLALGAVQTEMLNKAFPGYKAPLSASEMGDFIYDFFNNGPKYFNGQTIPVSLTTP